MKKRYNEFSGWLLSEEKSLKKKIFYIYPVSIVVLLLVIIFPRDNANISLLQILVSFLFCLVLYLRLVVYPSIRTVKLINHLVNKIEIKDNYCYIHCRNMLKDEVYYKVYELDKLSLGEREVFQEKFFRSNEFIVLNAGEDKYYLMGDLLAPEILESLCLIKQRESLAPSSPE